jgi:hypothetical protein
MKHVPIFRKKKLKEIKGSTRACRSQAVAEHKIGPGPPQNMT